MTNTFAERIARYRTHADKARARAELALSPEGEAELRLLGRLWDAMADEIERFAGCSALPPPAGSRREQRRTLPQTIAAQLRPARETSACEHIAKSHNREHRLRFNLRSTTGP